MLPIWKGLKADSGDALTRVLGAYILSSVIGLAMLAGLFLSGCAGGDLTKEGILREVNNALTDADCDRAIELIEPLYNSNQTDNEVRIVRASAHGCKAGINFFEVLDEIATSNLVGPAFWEFSTRIFPSIATDEKLEASWLAYDALMASAKPGSSIPASLYANPDDEFNLGTVKASQRTSDSNLYMIEVALAVMGTANNRYGSPDASYQQGTRLPWSLSTSVTDEGCAYAAAITSFLDGITEIQDVVDPATATSLTSASAAIEAAVAQACELGCSGNDVLGAGATGSVEAACTFTDCSGCPDVIRSRTACMTDTDPRTKCAVAGIIRFVNDHPLGWTGAP